MIKFLAETVAEIHFQDILLLCQRCSKQTKCNVSIIHISGNNIMLAMKKGVEGSVVTDDALKTNEKLNVNRFLVTNKLHEQWL